MQADSYQQPSPAGMIEQQPGVMIQQQPGVVIQQQPAIMIQQQLAAVIQQQPSMIRRGPDYLNHGIRLYGLTLSFRLIWSMAAIGMTLFFSGILYLFVISGFPKKGFEDDDDDDWYPRKPPPSNVPGILITVIGGGMIVASIYFTCYAKKKYLQLNSNSDNPGQGINPVPNPIQQPNVVKPGLAPYGTPQEGGQLPQYSPSHANMAAPGTSQAGYFPQGGYNPQQPEVGYAPQHPQGGYAPQPPVGYFQGSTCQPSEYPPPYSAPTGPAPGFPSSPGNQTKYPLPSNDSSAPQ